MLYSLHELQRQILRPLAEMAGATADVLAGQTLFPARIMRAHCALLHRTIKDYRKPRFGLGTTIAHGREVAVVEHILVSGPFCRLVRFTRTSQDPATAAALAADPKVLVCAPLSGHHPTLLRDTVATLLPEHDVYITDWVDARDVPVAAGPFHLDDYVALIQGLVRELGPELHLLAVCQPTVPVLAAVSLMATAGEPTPLSMTLMGGPIDPRQNPTQVNRFAIDHSLSWFATNMIHRVPASYPGHGREVYPGFLQLAAFVMMNPGRHALAHQAYWFDQLRGRRGTAAVEAHERFYDEYNAVLDMDAAYYLDTVKTVFQECALPRGTWTVAGRLVQPAAITRTALFTIEGALDDISGLGQTEAALVLCRGIPAAHKRHMIAAECGHYGLFSGHRWRETIYPELRAFIRAHEAP